MVKTFQRLLDPALHSPIADTFKTDKGTVKVTAQGPSTVTAEFPAPTASIEIIFDQVRDRFGAGAISGCGTQAGRFHSLEEKSGVLEKASSGWWTRSGSISSRTATSNY